MNTQRLFRSRADMSPLEQAAQDGNFEEFRDLIRESSEGGYLSLTDMIDTMDIAYRGTKMGPPVEGCDKIVKYLSKRGIDIPKY